MDLNALMQQALLRHGNTPGVILKAHEPTGQRPWEMFVTEEHTEQYLALKAGGESAKGLATGTIGGTMIMLFAISIIWMAAIGKWDAFAYVITLVIPLPILFLWEISQPLPLPILFNRRTREIYYDHDGELYHMPWDEAQAVACQFMTVGPYSGGMDNATLETVVRRYGDTEQALFIPLSPPMGKNLDMQCGFWAWLQAYMDNGPWFDENGQHSESDEFVRETIKTGGMQSSDYLGYYWRVITGREASPGNVRWMDIASLVGEILFYPMHRLQDFTCNIAKCRSRGQWPPLVRERLLPDGPTTRLVDLERAQGLNV